jgi:putative transposase
VPRKVADNCAQLLDALMSTNEPPPTSAAAFRLQTGEGSHRSERSARISARRSIAMLVERIWMVISTHLPSPVITDRTDDLALATHILCCSWAICLAAAASSKKVQGSMNLASNTAPDGSTRPSRVAPIHLMTGWRKPAIDVKSLHAKIGELTLENDFLEGALTKAGLLSAKRLIDREHDLSITRQAEVFEDQPVQRLLSAASGVARRPRDNATARPAAFGVPFRRFANVERPAGCRGCKIGRWHVKTLMRRMGIEALYRRPRTTKPEPGHKIYPYLLRGMEITRPNQVWAIDITYIPMERGFVYLAVVLDWATRGSITMEAAFCVETLEYALARHGKPEIFNTDQGSQFTAGAFTGALANNGIAINMDGRGAWRDNVFVERLWRSVKYEEVYLRAYDSVCDARASIGRYLDFYNRRRPHSSL